MPKRAAAKGPFSPIVVQSSLLRFEAVSSFHFFNIGHLLEQAFNLGNAICVHSSHFNIECVCYLTGGELSISEDSAGVSRGLFVKTHVPIWHNSSVQWQCS